jgi:hypothetical protein
MEIKMDRDAEQILKTHGLVNTAVALEIITAHPSLGARAEEWINDYIFYDCEYGKFRYFFVRGNDVLDDEDTDINWKWQIVGRVDGPYAKKEKPSGMTVNEAIELVNGFMYSCKDPYKKRVAAARKLAKIVQQMIEGGLKFE